MQERQARTECLQYLIAKGGFHFLLYMFSKINKQIDFEKELLASKTLQLLISILDRLHQGKCTPLLQLHERPHHIRAMMQGCFVLINSFLIAANEKQEAKREELVAKLTSQNNNECTPAVMS